MSVYQELKRRNVFRVAAAYAVTAWLLIEVSATLEETLRLPEWADTLLAMFLLLGFPVALFFSWAFEVTPEGIKREQDLERDHAIRSVNRRKLDRVIVVMMALALGYFALDKFVIDGTTPDIAAEDKFVIDGTTPDIAAEQGAEVIELPTVDPGRATETAAPELSIAVLPFVNMSSDPEQEYFSDGLTEELLNLLADIAQLKVAARTSSFYYKNKTEDIPFMEIGRQLGVANLLEGSVRKSGNRIRITAQLIKAEDGFHLWSETWDRNLDDVFAIQDEIAAAVVDQLKVTLLGEAPHARVIDTESWELTLQARFFYNRRAEGDWQRALELFDRAIELDPDNAAALIGAAPLYYRLADPPDPEKARAATMRALELDPNNPVVRIRNAQWLRYEGHPEASKAEFQRALELGQDNAWVLAVLADEAENDGDHERSLELVRQAVRVDPLHILSIASLFRKLMANGEWEEAAENAEKAYQLSPTSHISISMLGDVRLRQGRPQEALDLAHQHPGPTPDNPSDGRHRLMAQASYSLGDMETSETALQELEAELPRVKDPYDKFAIALDIADVHAWRKEPDEAFTWLGKAFEMDQLSRINKGWFDSPGFELLHSDPRWEEVLARLENR
jgi:TolB-like protein/Flp pilus assembly protein TadD